MATVDLDAKRAARSEATNQPHEITLGGEQFTLPARIPLESIELMAEGAFRQAFRILLFDDPDQVDRFFSHRPDDGDLEEIMALYGAPGESSGSPASSPSNGSRLKPTSRATTTSTSRKRAGALPTSGPAGS
jgi:hypothetical protein